MESTLLLLTQGEAGVDCCDPFVDALQKRSIVHKYGPHIIICDLLVFAVKDGSSLSYISSRVICFIRAARCDDAAREPLCFAAVSFFFTRDSIYAIARLCDSDVSVRLSHAGIVPSRAKAGS